MDEETLQIELPFLQNSKSELKKCTFPSNNDGSVSQDI